MKAPSGPVRCDIIIPTLNEISNIPALFDALDLLQSALPRLPAAVQDDARAVLASSTALAERIAAGGVLENEGVKIRIHGDYHLGQVLLTRNDFVVVDCAPTGSTLRLLSLPDLMSGALRVLPNLLRVLSAVVSPVARNLVSLPLPRSGFFRDLQRLVDEPVKTFSIGFAIPEFDESSFARQVAARLGTDHHEFRVEPRGIEVLEKLAWHYDEPFADSSAIPTMCLAEMTRHEVTVALSGDGGDELFAGYDRYRAVRLGMLFDRLPRPLRALLTSRIWQKIPASVEQRSYRRRFKKLVTALGEPPERRYLRWICIMDDAVRQSLYTSDFRAELDGAGA